MKNIYILIILVFSSNAFAAGSSEYAFAGKNVVLEEGCVSDSLPSIKASASSDHVILSDTDGIVAFGMIFDTQSNDDPKKWLTSLQTMRFSDKFLGAVSIPFEGSSIMNILKDRVDEKGWPYGANTEVRIGVTDSLGVNLLYSKYVRNAHLFALDGCGKTSIMSIIK